MTVVAAAVHPWTAATKIDHATLHFDWRIAGMSRDRIADRFRRLKRSAMEILACWYPPGSQVVVDAVAGELGFGVAD